MLISEATVPTERAGRYLVQLCKHFVRKVPAEWTEQRGETQFAWGRCVLVADDTALRFTATAADVEAMDRIENVMTDHLERFGARDSLTLNWSRRPA